LYQENVSPPIRGFTPFLAISEAIFKRNREMDENGFYNCPERFIEQD
jgi:hypothetical protein